VTEFTDIVVIKIMNFEHEIILYYTTELKRLEFTKTVIDLILYNIIMYIYSHSNLFTMLYYYVRTCTTFNLILLKHTLNLYLYIVSYYIISYIYKYIIHSDNIID